MVPIMNYLLQDTQCVVLIY